MAALNFWPRRPKSAADLLFRRSFAAHLPPLDMRRLAFTLLVAVFAPSLVAGCDMLGIESAEKIAAAREADGKAIGSACRHAGRAIEDCFVIYKKADRAAVFAGWRDMNDYMRENKIEPVPPQLAQAKGSVVETR